MKSTDILQVRKQYKQKIYDFLIANWHAVQSMHMPLLAPAHKAIEDENKSWQTIEETFKKYNTFVEKTQSLLSKRQLEEKELKMLQENQKKWDEKIKEQFVKHQTSLNKLSSTQQQLVTILSVPLVNFCNIDIELVTTHQQVMDTTSELLVHCQSWKKEHINDFTNIVQHIYEILDTAENILSVSDLLNTEIPQKYKTLYQYIQMFIQRYHSSKYFKKYKIVHHQLKETPEILFNPDDNDSKMKKAVNFKKVQQYVIDIFEIYSELLQAFEIPLGKMLSKQQHLLSLCTTAGDLQQQTVREWVQHHAMIYQKINQVKVVRQQAMMEYDKQKALLTGLM